MPRLPFFLLGLASAAFYLVFIARTAFDVAGATYFSLFDDAMISMRFARNLASGFGLTWNPGEAPVEGYTNFLWTLYMAGLHALPIAPPMRALVVMLTGVAILLGLLAVVRAIAARLSGDAFVPTWTAVALTAFYYPLVFWTLRGMEVGALLLLVYGAMALAFRLLERFRMGELGAIAGLLAMALLTRLDAVIPHVLISGFLLLTLPRERKVAATALLGASFVGPLAGHTLFRRLYYHEWLPNTYYLKVTGVSLGDRLSRGLKTLLQAFGFNLLAYLAPVPAALSADRRRDPRIWLLVALIACQAAYSVYVGGDAWEWVGSANRFLTAAVPALAVLAGLGVGAIIDGARGSALKGGFAVLGAGLAARGAILLWPPTPDWKHAAAWAGIGLAVAVIGWVAADRLARAVAYPLAARPILSTALVAAVLVLGANGRLYSDWVRHNAVHVADDANATRLGLFLNRTTQPDAVIAVTWAGAIPYFADRATLDLLGKSDPVIAKGPPATPEFFPGHNKWNFAYSIGQLQPDVVVQYYESDGNDRDIANWGYERLENGMFVRRDSTRVDRAAIGQDWKTPAELKAP